MQSVAEVISKMVNRKVGDVRIKFHQNSMEFEKNYSHGMMFLTVEFEFKGKPLKDFIFGSMIINRIENTNQCYGVLLYGKETQQIMKALWGCFDPEGEK